MSPKTVFSFKGKYERKLLYIQCQENTLSYEVVTLKPSLISCLLVTEIALRGVPTLFSKSLLNVYNLQQNKTNSVVLVRKETIPTERPQPVGEVSANF
jgi:hypothetical protein